MKLLKYLFGSPATKITQARSLPAPPPAKPKVERPPAPGPDEDEITLIDPVAKDVWSIGRPEMQQKVPPLRGKPGPKRESDK